MLPATQMTFTIPLSLEAHQQADYLRRQQPNSRKAKQVYLNTLAVYAVHAYLEGMGVTTDLVASDSQNAIQVALSDVADLVIPDVGTLECRPVLPNATVVSMPLPKQPEQIGGVAVQLDATLRQATLLGFLPTWTAPEMRLTALHPLFALLEAIPPPKPESRLHQWVQNQMATSWKTLEQILDDLAGSVGPSTPIPAFRSRSVTAPDRLSSALPDTIPALLELFQTNSDKWTRLQILGLLSCIAEADETAIAFLTHLLNTTDDEELRRQAAVTLGTIQPRHVRGGVRRAKVVELGMQLNRKRLALVITLTPELTTGIEVHLRLYPTTDQPLPAHLHLSILDESGNTFLEEQTLGDEDWLQLVFNGTPGDRFQIQLKLGEALFREAFVL